MFRRAAKPVAGVVLVAALAFAGTLSGIEWHRADVAAPRSHQLVQREVVGARAGEAATALFTFDYRNLAATQHRLSALATGGFAQLEAAQSGAVQQRLRKEKAIGTATVKELNVSDVSAGHATAFVVLATHLTSAAGTSDGVAYVHLDLRLVGSQWKIDDVQNLSAPK